jgi:hypothetical protein
VSETDMSRYRRKIDETLIELKNIFKMDVKIQNELDLVDPLDMLFFLDDCIDKVSGVDPKKCVLLTAPPPELFDIYKISTKYEYFTLLKDFLSNSCMLYTKSSKDVENYVIQEKSGQDYFCLMTTENISLLKFIYNIYHLQGVME